MPRSAVWKGFLSFGLVEIPVELVSAERSHKLSFHLFDRRDHSPVGNLRVNKATGDEVPWEEIVKGYEYAPDEYVMLSDEELRSANPEATQAIEILDFVDAAELHPVSFDRPYYLRPSRKRGHKAYKLLHETLGRTHRLGVARIVLRTREHLAALTVRGPALVLCLLRYADELVDAGEIGLPDEELEGLQVQKKEIELASRLVEEMSGEWKPERYVDAYRKDVMAMIERKVKAGQLEAVEAPARAEPVSERAEVLDLMPLLKRSVEGRSGRRPGRSGGGARAPRAKRSRAPAGRRGHRAPGRRSA